MTTQTLAEYPWPEIAIDQDVLYNKLSQYIDFKRNLIKHDTSKSEAQKKKELENCVLPFNTANGLCSGLVQYWLYLKRDGNEDEFIRQLEYIANWRKEQLDGLEFKQDSILEQFLNNVESLHFDFMLRYNEGIKQESIAESLNFLLEPHQEQVRQEFNLSFVFNKPALQNTIDEFVKPNKMVYLNNMHHALGLMRSGDSFYLYDPGYKPAQNKPGVQKFSNSKDLVKAIFSSYTKHNKSKDFLTLYMSFLDIGEENVAEYKNALDYCDSLIKAFNFNTGTFLQSDILHVLVKFHDLKTLKYLLSLGVRFDVKTSFADTLLGIAIVDHDYTLLYLLLCNGADLNSTHNNLNLWQQAIFSKNPEALALLLAFGYPPPEDKSFLSAGFSQQQTAKIFTTALQLHTELLHVPAELDLSASNAHDITMYLRHARLMRQLGREPNFVVHFDGNSYQGIDALYQISNYYKNTAHNDMFDAAQKTEMYSLLKFFKADRFKFKGSKELVNLLSIIEKQIYAKKLDEHSKEEIIEIGIIMDQLEQILMMPTGINPGKHYLHFKAAHLKDVINKYLRKNGISSLKDYINQQDKESMQRNYIFFTLDKDNPELKADTAKVFGILQRGLGLSAAETNKAINSLQ